MRVRNVKGSDIYLIGDNGTTYRKYKSSTLKEPKVLTPSVTKDGYLFVRLQIDGKPKGSFVHRLVAEAFLDNPDNLPCVNHINEDKTNNCVENLEWCTHKDNMHAYNNPGVTPDRVPAIKTILAKALSVRQETREIFEDMKMLKAELEALKDEIHHEVLLMEKNKNQKYEGYKNIAGEKFSTVEAMVSAVGKPVNIEGVGSFPSAGSAARYITQTLGKGDQKDVSRRIRRYLGDKNRSVCSVYGFTIT